MGRVLGRLVHPEFFRGLRNPEAWEVAITCKELRVEIGDGMLLLMVIAATALGAWAVWEVLF